MMSTESHGPVTVLRMEHGKANALDLELLEGLEQELEAFETSTQGALVLTGQGSIFGAGVDLYRLVDGGDAYLDLFLEVLSRMFRRLYALPKPAVAAVNGHAIAGGCLLALACERRLMAKGKGSMGVTELLVGVPFPAMALEILHSGLAPNVVEDLLYTGRLCSPEECQKVGLIHRLVDREQLLGEAVEEAQRLAAIAPETYRMTKVEMRAAALDRVDGSRANYDQRVRRRWHDPRVRELIRQFMKSTVG